MYIYTVRQGDSLYTIARKFGVTAQEIAEENQIRNPELLAIGQALVITADSVRHTVLPGESLDLIARRYETTIESLLRANPEITNRNLIRTGQVIVIPGIGGLLGTYEVNGYVFPTVGDSVLERTLPNLTYCSIFSHQVTPDGSLTETDDGRIIGAARQNGVAPVMTITNIKPGGGFSSELAHTVLTSEAVQNTLLENVLRTLETKNYYGLNIDFEYIFQQDRDDYNRFIRKAAARVRAAGYAISSSLAPKTGPTQRGLLYEAHDYPVHGEVMDHVILMTYEWGYTYGPARPVAPLNLVEQVIRYAVSVIPNKKILMGIPNYGYDWTLPFVRGSSARSLTNPGAVDLAARMGAQIRFDEQAQSPFFNYYDIQGKRHEVWFEDARSIEAKLRLADRYGLGGVSYWTVNSYFSQNWLVLNTLYRVSKVL